MTDTARWRRHATAMRLALVAALSIAPGVLLAQEADPAAKAAGMSAALTPGAQPPPESEWPCVQRRAGTISAGVVWSGPDPAAAGPWDKDFDAAALAQKLASRRTPVEEVDGLLDAFVQATPAADKDTRLTRVFSGVLDLVNTERNRVMSGIGRYARGQNRLAERVREESDTLGDLTDAPNTPRSKDQQDIETALKWDRRIFEERSRALTYVCETPVLLERRVFDIARRIQQRL